MRIHTTTLLIIGLFWTGFSFAQCDTEFFCAPPTLNCASPSVTFGCVVTGNAPFSFIWQDNQGNIISADSIVSMNLPGLYTLQITDGIGCTESTIVEVLEDTLIPDCAISIEDSPCAGSPALLGVDCGGGNGALSYLWQVNGIVIGTEQEITATIGGFYCVDVTDDTGCTITDCISLPEPPASMEVLIFPTQQPRCNSDNSGALTAVVSGGVPPYTYLWSNGATATASSGLFPGPHSVTVTDINGCEAIANIDLMATLQADAGADQVVYCEESIDIEADAFSYNTIGFSNTIFGGAEFSDSQQDLIPFEVIEGYIGENIPPATPQNDDDLHIYIGSATASLGDNICIPVTVDNFTDVVGMAFALYYDPSYLQFNSIINTNPTLPGFNVNANIGVPPALPDGFITVNYFTSDLSGINLPNDAILFRICFTVIAEPVDLTYEWTGPNNFTSNSLTTTATESGTYTLRVTNNSLANCWAEDEVEVTFIDTIAIDLIEDQTVYCEPSLEVGLADASTAITVSDDSPIPVEVLNMTFLNVGAELTNGYIGANLPSNSSPSSTSPLQVFVGSQGGIPGEIIEIEITLGEFDDLLSIQLPLEYDINLLEFVDVVYINDAIFPILDAGLNTPDQANGVEGFIGISWFDQSFSGIDISDKTILITFRFVLLAQPQNHIYAWTGPNDFTNDNPVVTLTESGIYTVAISDSNFPNCWAEDEVEITFIDSLSVDIGEGTILYCEDVPYTINSQVSGGESTYDYLWSTGENTPSITISPAPGETYYLTVTDAGGCVGIDSVLMAPALPILIQPIADLFLCEGESVVINPLVSGGVLPYVSYEWSTGEVATAITINLSGTYSLTVTDQNGCMAEQTFTAFFSPSPIITLPAQYNICPGESVTLTPIVSGGIPPFAYLWSDAATTSSTITVAPLVTTSYTVTIVDSNGCTASIETQVLVNSLAAFPSPPFCDDDGTPSDPNDDAYFVEAYFTGGAASGWIATSPTGTQSGAYDVPVVFGPFPVLGGDVEIQVVDAENPDCNILLPVSAPDCIPDCDIEVQILNENCDFGGTPSDTSDDTFTFDVIVTGTNTSTSWLASNGQTGTYDEVTAFGPFTLASIPLELIFFDGNDSECTDMIELNPDCTPLFCGINTSISTVSCDDNDTPSDGTDDLYTITFFASGGASDSFQLSLLDEVHIGAYLEPLVITTPLIEGNSYDVNVVDNEDPTCTDFISFTAPPCVDPCEDTDIITTITSIDVSCNGGSDACIEITADGGTAPYTYNWMFGDTSPFICGLPSDTYSVTVTDANGCNEVQEISIDEPPLLQGFITEVQAPTCETSFDGILQIDVVGGTGPYEYIWSNGATPPQLNGLGPGTYSITVVDANGCTWAGQYTLLPSIIAEAGSPMTINCLNASVTLDGSGSSAGPDIVYEWTYPDGTISNDLIITVNEPGVYELRVTNTAEPDCHSFDQVTVTTDIVNLEVGYNLISCDSANLFYTPFLPSIAGDWTFPDGSTTAISTFTGTTQTGMHYLDVVDANSGCVYADSIFVDLDPNTCVSLKGRLVRDTLEDCIPTLDEPGLCNWLIVIEGEGNVFYAVSQADGYYEQDVPAGNYEVYPLLPSGLWIECEDSYMISLNTPGDMAMLDIPIQEQEPCPDLSVDFSLPLLRRCWTRSLVVNYCNNGTATAENAYVEVTLDEAFTYQSATAPLISQDGQTFTFDVGDVAINQCDNFKITFVVSCDAIVGESLCAEAKIFPNAPCEAIDPLWSGASLSVTSECEEDNVSFRVENIGTADMDLSSACIVIEDGLMLFVIPDSLRLDAGDFYDYEFPANGSTYRLEIEQVPFHPGFSQPIAVLEGCGEDDFGDFSTGFVNQFPFDDTDDFIDIECREVVGSYDPNDKHGFPRGYGDENYIYPGTDLEYLINFQNTGNDTAFLVVIRDTLSEHLDITSVRTGGASHSYTWDIDDDNILVFTFDNILLPDSTTNLEGSQGFIEYKVAQRADLPLGTVIENSAAIYFDINEPIITNTTSHKLGEDFIEVINLTIAHTLIEATVRVVPNPAKEEAVFNLDSWPEGEKIFELIDTKGQIVVRQVFSGSTFSFQRGFLTNGLYFFRLLDEQGHWAAGKLQLH